MKHNATAPRFAAGLGVAAALFFLAASPLAAQVDEDALFGGDTATNGGPTGRQGSGSGSSNPDDMFSGDNVHEGGTDGEFKEEFLNDEAIKIGGNFSLDMGTRLWWPDFINFEGDWIKDNTEEEYALNLNGSLFFSARPSQDVRFYGKVKTKYPFSVSYDTVSSVKLSENPYYPFAPDSLPYTLSATGNETITVPQLSIYELYSDFAVSDSVVIKAGKQAAKWGVGYFWSPADIISLTPVDIDDPTAEREGPVAIKTNIAFGLNTLDFYVVAGESVESLLDLGLASRVVLFLGDFELGVGAGYQRDRSLQVVSTLAGGLGPFNVFAEAKLSNGSLRRVLKENADEPTGIEVVSYAPVDGWADEWFFAGTVGGSWAKSDPDIGSVNLLVQYYFNSEGYQDSSILGVDDIGTKVYTLIAEKKVGVGDLFELGRHYTALNVSFSPGNQKDFTISTAWIANWSDLSGQINPGLSIKIIDHVTLAINSSFIYGVENTEYVGVKFDAPVLDSNNAPTGEFKQTTLNFRNPFGRMSLGFTLNIGSGNF